jgi:hexosaminidase
VATDGALIGSHLRQDHTLTQHHARQGVRSPRPAHRLARQHVTLGLLLGAAIGLSTANTHAAERVLENEHARVTIGSWQRGVTIVQRGLLVSRGSSMVVTTPPWTPHYYLGPQPNAVEQAEQRQIDGGVELVMHHRGQHDAFLGDDVVRLFDNGRVERELHGRFTKDTGEALIQWRVAALNPVLIIGKPYEAELNGGTRVRGVVPVTPRSGDADATALAKGFRWIAFESRIGLLRIEVSSDRPLICYDYRGSRWADPSQPLFWLGDLGTRFGANEPLHYRITFHPPATPVPSEARPVLQGHAQLEATATAQQVDLAQPPTIVPRPKEAEFTTRHLRLSGGDVAVYVADPAANKARDDLDRFLRTRHGRAVTSVADQAEAAIRFTPADDALPAEGYLLEIDADAATIRAADAAGFLHAVQTLKQLIVPRSDGQLLLRGARIRDWPSLAFRGVHLFTGGQGPDLHLKLVRAVLAPLKLNHLVLESEYIEWDCCPEIHHPEYGMPKGDVRRILAAARELGIEVTPLVMSLGHCQWMFHNDQNLDLAEDPDAKWAYCVTNPRTYDFIYRVYQEAVDLFEPRMFHIGHDEFTERGRVPYRASSKPYTPNELLVLDTLRHHAWLGERGIRLMMWGDMLLGPGEGPDACHADHVDAAQALRAALPSDIIITDWHYADVPAEKFTNLDVLHAAGFETIAATWYRPGNIVNFAQAAKARNARGLLQTTWAGYSLDPASFAREMHQYAIYVLAAEAAWNADRPIDPDALLHGEHFLRLMGRRALTPAQRGGWCADLGALYNERLTAADERGWFGFGPEHDLSAVPGGTVRFDGVAFELGAPDQPNALVLASKLAPDARYPKTAILKFDASADQLVFLHATNFACAPDAPVGRYVVVYADGTEAPLALHYGQNIFAVDDLTAAADAPIVWTARTAAGARIALRALVWHNPHPARTIRAIRAESANTAGGLVWLGLTGLHDEHGRE